MKALTQVFEESETMIFVLQIWAGSKFVALEVRSSPTLFLKSPNLAYYAQNDRKDQDVRNIIVLPLICAFMM